MERRIVITEPTIEKVQGILESEVEGMKLNDGVLCVYSECLFYLSHDLYLWVLKQPPDTFGHGFMNNISGDIELYGIPARLDMSWEKNSWSGSIEHTYAGKHRGEDRWHISKSFYLLDRSVDMTSYEVTE